MIRLKCKAVYSRRLRKGLGVYIAYWMLVLTEVWLIDRPQPAEAPLRPLALINSALPRIRYCS